MLVTSRLHCTPASAAVCVDSVALLVLTELRETYDAVRKKIPKERKQDLPKIPGDSGASTDRVVVAERKRWIEEFFRVAFELLDERMQFRQVGQAGGDNEWETNFARQTYVVHRLAATRQSPSSWSARGRSEY